MKVYILTPEKTLYEGDAKTVKVPGLQGQFEILDRHAPIVSALSKGTVKLTDSKGEKHSFEIHNGFVEVMKNEVNVLVRV
ncbi:MAG: ATP synthase F1 subunit epsilon [Saprospiraceae bacterium]|nr:ATP synthase F1 subunit epsilon [Saprospiraceae bacterium]MBK8450660.1 ATP synthase F1 subunit epsilon [Saprospiraceae bacterium]MBK8485261.1 ATP synthase F1 subunit epsilon [Saprospiraceae bacterium]MBK9222477.1 ATP synthase F1 subunit epsilon [Saprospiraceae bacterium]MBK9720488.1 ATP synthase F1 subunit epsilon [Saprospiraceae bacterium]